MVTTALASGICPAAARIAAPPRLWPIRIVGACSGFAQMIGGVDEVGDVRRKGRVGEFAFAVAEPGEVEPQHRDAARRQRGRDALRRQHVLAAGEAMRKQRIGVDRAIGLVQRRGKLMAAFAGELKAFGRHGRSPCGSDVRLNSIRRNSAVRPRDRRGCDSRGLPNSPAHPCRGIRCSAAIWRSSRNRDAAPPAAPGRHGPAPAAGRTSYGRAGRPRRQNPPAPGWWCSRHANAAPRSAASSRGRQAISRSRVESPSH